MEVNLLLIFDGYQNVKLKVNNSLIWIVIFGS